MPYSNLADALARAKERSGATAAADEFLTELLNQSAGVDRNGVIQYRPYFVAAKFLEQNISAQTLSKAKGGVEFTGLWKPIRSLLELQQSLDKALGLAIPEGFEINLLGSYPRYPSRSLIPTIRP